MHYAEDAGYPNMKRKEELDILIFVFGVESSLWYFGGYLDFLDFACIRPAFDSKSCSLHCLT